MQCLLTQAYLHAHVHVHVHVYNMHKLKINRNGYVCLVHTIISCLTFIVFLQLLASYSFMYVYM